MSESNGSTNGNGNLPRSRVLHLMDDQSAAELVLPPELAEAREAEKKKARAPGKANDFVTRAEVGNGVRSAIVSYHGLEVAPVVKRLDTFETDAATALLDHRTAIEELFKAQAASDAARAELLAYVHEHGAALARLTIPLHRRIGHWLVERWDALRFRIDTTIAELIHLSETW